MKSAFALMAGCAVAASSLVLAVEKSEKLECGVAYGEDPPPFYVRDVTGPKKDSTLCYRCEYGSRPVVAIFARRTTPALADLLKKIDEKVAKQKDEKLAAFAVVLTDDPDAVAPKLTELAEKAKLAHTPLTILEDPAGPADYKLAQDAEVTVLMWNEDKLIVNRGFAKDKLDKKAIESLVAETKKILE